jgi:transposase
MASEKDKSSLPDDIDQLKQLILDMQEKQEKQDALIESLKEEILFIKGLKHARKSEKWTAEDKKQMDLFNEMEQIAEESDQMPEEPSKKNRNGKNGGRKPIPESIPREEVIHDIPEEEKICPHCHSKRPLIGQDESEELRFIPAKVIVKKHIKLKYGPCTCDDFQNDEDIQTIVRAKAPPRIMPGSIASSGILSYILVSKFGDSLPFNRMERIFKRVGLDISRTNMANWSIKAAKACEPLIELMRELSREGPLINMDETTVQVLKEPGRKPENKSYMWITVGSNNEHKTVLFNYSQTRKEEVALSLLNGFSGILQTDGYAGYNKAAKEYKLYHVGCLAHARRKFYEAAKATKSGGKANKALKLIQKIYRIEKELREKDLDQLAFSVSRRKQSIPIWQEFHRWLKEMSASVPPKTKLGEAVTYTLNEYHKLVRYMKDAATTPDNNIAENAIRPFVIGRKNWLFCDSPKGAHASAVIYSLCETAMANKIEPQEYLFQLFEKLPRIDSTDRKALEQLLPWNIAD